MLEKKTRDAIVQRLSLEQKPIAQISIVLEPGSLCPPQI